MEEYNKLSTETLRDLLLENKLLHEFMTEEDYTALLDIEAEFDEPNEKVIDFCFTGLSTLPKYEDIKVRDFDINDLFKQNEKKNTIKKYRKTKRIFLIAVIMVLTLLFSQVVATAFGFDLFGYIFNWNKSEVVEIKNDSIINIDDGKNQEIEYSTIDEIPIEMKNLIPSYVFDNFKFYSAVFVNLNNNIVYNYFFFDKNENILTINIEKSARMEAEKDDIEYREEYLYGNTLFKIFTNMSDYRATWVLDGYNYKLYTHYDDLQEFKNILNSLY